MAGANVSVNFYWGGGNIRTDLRWCVGLKHFHMSSTAACLTFATFYLYIYLPHFFKHGATYGVSDFPSHFSLMKDFGLKRQYIVLSSFSRTLTLNVIDVSSEVPAQRSILCL